MVVRIAHADDVFVFEAVLSLAAQLIPTFRIARISGCDQP
jgi:hypothetical protein